MVLRKYFAELIGTYILVLFGTGAAVMTNVSSKTSITALGIALAFGLAFIIGAYSLGHISGGHFNPSVSFGMLLDKRLSIKDFLIYVIFQILGALLASTTIWVVLSNLSKDLTNNFGQNSFGELNMVGAFIVEVVLTAVFVFVVLSVTTTKFILPQISILVIGLALTTVHLVGIPLSGTSVNPARSIGPAVFAGGEALKELWLFIIAPLVGSIISFVIYKLFDSYSLER